MKNAVIFLPCMLALAMLLSPGKAKAQSLDQVPTRITVHVEGLTSATRDAIARSNAPGNPRIAFACVPAGILVLESTSNEDLARFTTKVQSALSARNIAVGRTRIIDQTLAQAETACAEIRNR